MGLAPGDVILTANQRRLFYAESLEGLLLKPMGVMRVVIFTPPPPSTSSPPTAVTTAFKIDAAKSCFRRVAALLDGDADKHRALLRTLKLYADSKDIRIVTQSLNLLLTTPQQRRVIACIRPYIPKHHLDPFDRDLNWRSVAAAEAEAEAAAAAAKRVKDDSIPVENLVDDRMTNRSKATFKAAKGFTPWQRQKSPPPPATSSSLRRPYQTGFGNELLPYSTVKSHPSSKTELVTLDYYHIRYAGK